MDGFGLGFDFQIITFAALSAALVLAVFVDIVVFRRILRRVRVLETSAIINEQVVAPVPNAVSDTFIQEMAADVNDVELSVGELQRRVNRIEKTYVKRKAGAKRKKR